MKIKFFMGLFFIGLLFSNYHEKIDLKCVNLASQNISLLQANATEMWCDATTTKECIIGSAKGTGFLIAKD